MFELRDVHYSYLNKFTALNGISMDIPRGEKIVLLGANGSGKSTLLQMLDGLIFPSRGSISFFGEELKESVFNSVDFTRKFRSKVGFVFQNPDIQLFCPTVREDIIFGPLQFGVPKDVIKKRLDQLAQSFNIGHLLERSPHQLSVGEKRKVAIASTLAIDPDVLILDEPTAGLDPLTTRYIVDIILSAHEQGKTVISATHDLHLVSEISDT
ncbi:MAG: ABC transporter ATP-binding protein, partial [Candidatus Omnitrophica bacterium]|nr:ABC transporter ATP-binding protein [Candidatus Omnitrophota bacterium]